MGKTSVGKRKGGIVSYEMKHGHPIKINELQAVLERQPVY